ncbi:hypothetical protein DYB38_011318 [Aphanomyces astaci]|uniref:CNNM transmembrane domain-containing protein n=1 Tax=Aphanomyces astaci TaxID=112090 RepID=A0A397CE35_APHAT|nr:hypothetical protein DYB38_011318 [Aphanomyces astaci]
MEQGDGGDSPALWIGRVVGIVVLVAMSALFSGLTLGLMSLDKVGLEVVIGAGEDEHATEKEKAKADAAKRIAPIRKDGNLLLTTLLLGNVAVNSLMSIIMADITSGFLGFIVSTVVIVLFGEIFPQAACSRHALAVGAKSIPVVKVIICAFYAFAKPVSMVLDWLLGQDVGTIFTKKELWKMLDIHVKQEMIDDEESWIMYGALHYKSQQVAAVMTPIDRVFMLVSTAKLNADTMRDIYHSGFSRIPVWRKTRNDIIGLLFTKDLVFIDPEDAIPVEEFIQIFGRGVHRVWPDANLGDLLKAFKMGRSRLALVQEVNNTGAGDPYLEAVGIVTLEDVVEEILQDTFRNEPSVDMHRHRKEYRHVDFGKMRLLGVDVDMDQDMFLTPDERIMMLRRGILEGGALSSGDVQTMLLKCPLVAYGKSTANGAEILSKAHVVNHCVFVMEGAVKVSTRHGLFKEMGTWSVLAPECLVSPENAYLPDFTATVGVHHAKIMCLHIPRMEFQQMLHPINLAGVRSVNNARPRAVKEPTPSTKRFHLPSLQIHPIPPSSSSSPFSSNTTDDDDMFDAKQSLLGGDIRSTFVGK